MYKDAFTARKLDPGHKKQDQEVRDFMKGRHVQFGSSAPNYSTSNKEFYKPTKLGNEPLVDYGTCSPVKKNFTHEAKSPSQTKVGFYKTVEPKQGSQVLSSYCSNKDKNVATRSSCLPRTSRSAVTLRRSFLRRSRRAFSLRRSTSATTTWHR